MHIWNIIRLRVTCIVIEKCSINILSTLVYSSKSFSLTAEVIAVSFTRPTSTTITSEPPKLLYQGGKFAIKNDATHQHQGTKVGLIMKLIILECASRKDIF